MADSDDENFVPRAKADTHFRSKSGVKIQKYTEETLPNKATLDDLEPDVREVLERKGVKDLFLVQQATYQPFVEGRELIVKSRTGTGKTLSFLLPLTKLVDSRKRSP